MDVTESPEYFAGYEWAGTHLNELRELFSSKDIGPELRGRLFGEAMKFHPSVPGDMENEWKQTTWVTGAIRFVVDKLPLDQDTLRVVWDVGMDLGQIVSAERWKYECWKQLKKKPAGWWRRKFGDATPNDVVSAFGVAWRRNEAKYKEKGRPNPVSKWEVLVDRAGSREMCALADLERVELVKDGDYWYYRVEGEDNSFEVMMRPVYHNGNLIQGTGEIIG